MHLGLSCADSKLINLSLLHKRTLSRSLCTFALDLPSRTYALDLAHRGFELGRLGRAFSSNSDSCRCGESRGLARGPFGAAINYLSHGSSKRAAGPQLAGIGRINSACWFRLRLRSASALAGLDAIGSLPSFSVAVLPLATVAQGMGIR